MALDSEVHVTINVTYFYRAPTFSGIPEFYLFLGGDLIHRMTYSEGFLDTF